MSFPRNQWPEESARLLDDEEEGALPAHRIIPQSFASLCRWGKVITRANTTDLSRQNSLVYHLDVLPPDGRNAHMQVAVRLQGFLGKHDFGVFGNWQKDEDHCRRANQFLVLADGGFPNIFSAQRDCLTNIRTLIARTLRMGHVEGDDGDGRIHCQRRVFSKVTGGASMPPSVLTNEDDPDGVARAVAARWRVIKKVTFGRKLSNGRVVEADHLIFADGDFVDVHAHLEIATFCNVNNIPRTKLHVAFSQVIQLYSKDSLPPALCNGSRGSTVDTSTVAETESGVVIGKADMDYTEDDVVG
ncbi:hypothetical protein DENSPDRAFT_854922 [Dentipellis sp. KUC8613]|nr:hypothetical protein DENSPDRAFT_854922 [Dentipellis sp. KUC8613]